MFSEGSGQVEKTHTAVVNADTEEKTFKSKATSIAKSKLFKFGPIVLYLDRVMHAQELIRNNEMGVARASLYQLIKTYPDYPDAYVVLGDSFSKTKHQGLAVEYYRIASKIAPFDVDTMVKKAMQEQLLTSDEKPEISAQLAKAREFKQIEKSFRAWYHSKLRYQFLESMQICHLTEDNVDYQNIHLSLTAVRDAFFGFQAWEHDNCELAEYYFACAVIKFDDDFISWGCLTYLTFSAETIEGDELSEINKILDQHSYPIAYFTRFLYYYELGEDDNAYQDLKRFMSNVDKFEYQFLDSHKDKVLDFLLEQTVYEELNDEQAAAAKNAVKKVMQEIAFNKYKGEVDSKIELLNSLIHRDKDNHALYRARGSYYDHKGDIDAALLDFSVAIWLCPKDYLSVYYYNRAKCFLKSGETFAADQELERSLDCLINIKKDETPTGILQALHDFADLCLKVGRQNLKAEEFAMAEAVFALGIVRKLQALNDKSRTFVSIDKTEEQCLVLRNLYLECVEAKENNGKTDKCINDYLFNAIKNFKDWGPQSIAALRKKFNIYSKRIQRAREKSESTAFFPKKEIPSAPNVTPKMDKLPTFFKLTPPRAKGSKPAIKDTNPAPDFLELFDFNPDEPEKSKNIKTEEEMKREKDERDEAKKQRIREKKQRRLQGRKVNNNYQDDDSSSDSEDAREVVVPPAIAEIINIKRVELSEFEKNIFTMILELVPEELRKNYKIYLGGGWAYDKIRKVMLGLPVSKFNDFDLRTNIPAIYLKKLFNPVNEVKGLFMLMVDKIKIDLVFEPEIDNLALIAKRCDFLSLFIDPDGGVHDLNGFGLYYMQQQQLYSSVPPAEIFKDDPLRIFRAIYTATKRQCRFTTIKKQILHDRFLLIPCLSLDGQNAVDNLLNPHRFNIWMAKLFSQGMAITNFALLQKHKFNLLEVLFPSIYAEMLADIDWIENQMVITNSYDFPKIAIVYTSYIASALALRVPVFYSENELIKTPQLINAATEIYESSLLFQDAFKNVDELLDFLKRTFLDWKVQHELPLSEESATEVSTMRLGRR